MLVVHDKRRNHLRADALRHVECIDVEGVLFVFEFAIVHQLNDT